VEIFGHAPAEHKQAAAAGQPQLADGKGNFRLPLLAATGAPE
jgi:hypothetical protein